MMFLVVAIYRESRTRKVAVYIYFKTNGAIFYTDTMIIRSSCKGSQFRNQSGRTWATCDYGWA